MSNYRYEKMKEIKEVLQVKHVLPMHLQNKLIKELDFQIHTLENRNKTSSSPQKRHKRLKTMDISPKRVPYKRGLSIHQVRENECLKCRKFNFESQTIITCKIGQHMYHEKCLYELLKEQCMGNCSHFACICGQKLSPEQVRRMGIKGFDQLVEQFYDFQLQELMKSLPTQKCRSFKCNFFWVNQKKIQQRQVKPMTYCPFCL